MTTPMQYTIFTITSFVRTVQLRRAIVAVDEDPHLTFWRVICGNCFDIGVVEWCKLFGNDDAKKQPTHWKNQIPETDHHDFRLGLRSALGLTQQNGKPAARRSLSTGTLGLPIFNLMRTAQMTRIQTLVRHLKRSIFTTIACWRFQQTLPSGFVTQLTYATTRSGLSIRRRTSRRLLSPLQAASGRACCKHCQLAKHMTEKSRERSQFY
jgi:hypothetical protein